MAYIPKNGITTGQLILASNITNIIDTLDGTGTYDINATGSFTGSFVGSLIGSSSFATSASLATSASFVTSASFTTTASFAISSSYALTASIALQVSTSISTQNLQHSVLFVDTSGPGYIQVDGGLRYNPNQDLLTTTSSYALTASFATTTDSAVTSQTASYSTTLGATVGNVKDAANNLGAVELRNSNGTQLSTTGHFSASYAFTASYALNAGGASGSTPGGSNTQLQFNNAGVFGGPDTASTKYTFTGSLNISGSITGSINTIVNLSNLGNGTVGKLVIPTTAPASPVHGTMYMDAPGVGSVTLYIYNGNAGTYRSVTLN